MKHTLQNDYSRLAHPAVLEAMSAIGETPFETYGLDEYTNRAAQLIKENIENQNAQVHFACGGTQANLLVISSLLRPHEAVIAARSAHIYVHETGAIEATGHKICSVDTTKGKLSTEDIEAVVSEHTDEHMVLPRLVYISQTTETGMIYTKKELTEISEICKKHNLYLFIDGARLGAAVNSEYSDFTYADIAKLADAFYIGGTKNGAMFGEAIVFTDEAIAREFRYLLKQKGALISKGAILGIQFETLFKDGLYDKLSTYANKLAQKMAAGIQEAGYKLAYPSQSNMVFPILPENVIDKLRKSFVFYDWQKSGSMTTVRLVTSWATQESVVDEFLRCLGR